MYLAAKSKSFLVFMSAFIFVCASNAYHYALGINTVAYLRDAEKSGICAVAREKSSSERTALDCASGAWMDAVIDSVAVSGVDVNERRVAILSRFNSVKEISFVDCCISAATLDCLGGMRDIRVLVFKNSKISDAVFRSIPDSETLERLELDQTAISEEEISRLSRFPNLIELSLSRMLDSSKGLACLEKMRRLKGLRLPYSKVGDAELQAIANLHGLVDLAIPGNSFTDEGVMQISGLKNIAWLDLSHNGISSKGLAALIGMCEMDTLNLSMTNIDDEGLKYLSNMDKLTGVDLSGTQTSGAGLKLIFSLPELDILDLANTKVSDESLVNLRNARRIRILDLAGTPVTDACIESLAQLSSLKFISLNGTKVTQEGLKKLAAIRRDLKIVDKL